MEKQRILIVDDNEINRLIITSMLEDKYELLQATNGSEAVALMQSYHGDIDLLLLDLIMPVMDGMEVLQEMNEQGWIKDIPVIVISAETSTSFTRKAYELGAEDYIRRPFDPETVSRRIQKAILLHAERKMLMDAVVEEFGNRERQNDIMINILSHIVEYRNGESGAHVLHISIITELILKELLKNFDKYEIKEEDISLICSASSFHDIGKMGIPESILNKPGKLTMAEFEIMKTHSMLGYEMICKTDIYSDEPLVKYIKNICRYHHEKWDGNGYPDKLSGNDIPIEAQVVSMADVYDALTSERCYKKAYSHEKAVEMILAGECGVFNPDLIQCFLAIENQLKQYLETDGSILLKHESGGLISVDAINQLSVTRGTDVSRNIRLLRVEEQRHEAFRQFTDEAWFEYYTKPELIKLNPPAMKLLDLPSQMIDPFNNEDFIRNCGPELRTIISNDNVDRNDDVETFNKTVTFNNGCTYNLKGKLFFSSADTEGFGEYVSGAIGKITPMDVNDERGK